MPQLIAQTSPKLSLECVPYGRQDCERSARRGGRPRLGQVERPRAYRCQPSANHPPVREMRPPSKCVGILSYSYKLFRCPISGAILGRRDPCTTAGFFDEPTTEPAERTASNPSLSPQSCACAPFAIPASWCVHALRMPPQAARLVPEQAHDRCPGGAQPSSRRSSTLRWASRARPPPRRFRRCAAAPKPRFRR